MSIDFVAIKNAVASVPLDVIVGPVGTLSRFGKDAGLGGASHRHFMTYVYQLRHKAFAGAEEDVRAQVENGMLHRLNVRRTVGRVYVTYGVTSKTRVQSARVIDKHEHPKAPSVPQTERRAQKALELTVLRHKAAEYDRMVAQAQAA